YLGSVGKVDNGIVAVTSLWADERCYWPIHAVPYTPASRLPGGERDPGFKTKPQLAVELVQAARQAGIKFRVVGADCFYGDNPAFTDALTAAKVPFVLALKPRKGTWAPAEAAHTPVEAAGELGWRGPGRPGQQRRVRLRFRGGHPATWWGAAATPAPSQRPPGPAGEPCRGGAPVRAAQLGRAGLQAGQRRAGLGRLPSPLRPGHPPALGTGVLCVRLLLAGRPRRAACPTRRAPPPGRRSGRPAGGHAARASTPNRPSEAPGRW